MMYNREEEGQNGRHHHQYVDGISQNGTRETEPFLSNGPTRRRKPQNDDGEVLFSATPFVPPQEEEKRDDNEKGFGRSNRNSSSVVLGLWYRCKESCCGDGLACVEDERYYVDRFNEEPYEWSCGTAEEDGIWWNRRDKAGTVMACMVWVLLGYSMITITFLAETGGISGMWSIVYCTTASLALASHVKVQFTNPGAVPASAQPRIVTSPTVTMCSQCQTYKPPYSHHCRICNRCISRMDHHCPWMNNCIGANNFKHFILFLFYSWTCSALSLLLLGWNYFFCLTEHCIYTELLIPLARLMTILSFACFLFTSSMIMNVTYGILTGIGTIDRLKKKANDTMHLAEDEPIPLQHIFGIQPFYTWLLPIDPLFHDYDKVMGYSTPQRLLREQLLQPPNQPYSYAESTISTNSFLPV